MMLLILILIITATTFTASAAMNPLTLGLLILFMALMLAVTFATSMSSWVAMLIFLIYIGGMLVMFSYFVAITPNQNLSMPLIMSVMSSSLLAMSIVSYSMKINLPMPISYFPQMKILYRTNYINVLATLALILLFTMIVVVKISIHSKGPLRPFFKYV